MQQALRNRRLIVGFMAAAVLTGKTTADVVAADAGHGQQLYTQMCMSCHSVQYNSTGPMHRGVFGRPAGSVPGFEYSPALKHFGLVWNESNLDKWLTDPEAVAPGQKMGFMVPSAADRADLIAYLKTLKP